MHINPVWIHEEEHKVRRGNFDVIIVNGDEYQRQLWFLRNEWICDVKIFIDGRIHYVRNEYLKFIPSINYENIRHFEKNGNWHCLDGPAKIIPENNMYDYYVEGIEVQRIQLPKYYLERWNETTNEKQRFNCLHKVLIDVE